MATHTIVAKGSLGTDYVESPPGSGNYLVEAGYTIDLAVAPFSSGDTFIVTASADDKIQFEDSSGTAIVNIEFQESNANAFNVVVKDDIEANISIDDSVSLASVYVDTRSAGDVNMTIGDNVTLEEYQGSSFVDQIVIGDNFTTTKDFKTNNGDDTLTIGQNATAPKFDTGGDNDTVTSETQGVPIDNAETIRYPDGIVQGTTGDDTMNLGYTDADTDQITTGGDTIYGGVGNDTINGFTGNDTIYGDGLTPDALSDDPAPTQAAGPQSFTFDIDSAVTGGDGTASINIKNDVDGSGDRDLPTDTVFTDGATETLTEVNISEVGYNGDLDVFRFDLTTYDDDFTINISQEGTEDKFIITGVETVTDNGANSWTVTYTGSDGSPHTLTLNAGDAQAEFYLADGLTGVYDDTIDGGGGNDVIDAGFGEDDVTGGTGDDTILGGSGDDILRGNDGADNIGGGADDDTIYGGSGADILSGGTTDGAGPGRAAFKWSEVPDPNDGTEIDLGDPLTTGTQTVGDVDVSFSITQNVTYMPGGEDASGETYTAGIDGGTETVNVNSAASIDDDTSMTFTFSEEVENVQFRLNDLEINLGSVTVTAYDSGGNPVTINVTEGSNVYGSDTDAVAGNDTFSATNYNGDDTEGGSILVEIAGPVSSITIDYVSNGDSLTMTDVYFDAPPTLAEDGDDTIYGGADDDIILAGTGTDTISGGTGTDTYDAQNQAILTDETISVTVDDSGDGTVQKTNDGTTDTVTSVETYVADENAGTDTITLTTDYLAGDVTGLDDSATGTFTPAGAEPAINFGPGETYQLSDILNGTAPGGPDGTYQITGGDESGQIGNITFSNFETINFNVICFVRGTRILTPEGERGIETLQPGDMVMTMDHGAQPIRWIGSTRVLATGDLAPIRIGAGVLGNTRDLLVSPQHRMMLSGWQMELLFAEPEVLAPAKALVNDSTIRRQPGGIVEYVHMLFDDHEIVFAEGAPSESFHPGKVGMGSLAEESRAEILGLFPELRDDIDGYGPAARMSLKAHEAQVAMDALAPPPAAERRVPYAA